MSKATIVIPTFDHGLTLFRSVGSALKQTVADIEIFIIGDGVPDVSREIVAELMRQDDRVRFFDHPKGPRHGEIYRHEALAQARGKIVCYLADDDLWMPEHVETMLSLLGDADFAHTLSIGLDGVGGFLGWRLDLSLPAERARVLSGKKGVSLACMGHTLEMYRRLPFGWRTTPQGIASDVYMQQQFLAQPDCRAASGTRPTMLHFASPARTHWTPDERLAELDHWQRRLSHAQGRADFISEILDWVLRDYMVIENAATWRLRAWMLSLPLVGSLLSTTARAANALTR